MSRGSGRSRRQDHKRAVRRDPVARRSLPQQALYTNPRLSEAVTPFESRYIYRPAGFRSKVVKLPPSRVNQVTTYSAYPLAGSIIPSPWMVSPVRARPSLSVCARRTMRREVLHARGVAGTKGLGSPHYNESSKVRCLRGV